MFLLDHGSCEPAELKRRFDEYIRYLASIELPPSVRVFVEAPWYHDPADHRCPHDAWVERVSISEPSTGARRERRSLAIDVYLLGAYHDGQIQFHYDGVRSYSLEISPDCTLPPFGVGHGDWIADEIRLSDRGLVAHEIRFSSGSRWLIEAADIEYSWQPSR
jgi:hypothetical protein